MKAGVVGIRLLSQDRRRHVGTAGLLPGTRSGGSRECGSATLDNVRDRWLQSEATWTVMAARAARGEKMRNALIAEKAIERAAVKAATEA